MKLKSTLVLSLAFFVLTAAASTSQQPPTLSNSSKTVKSGKKAKDLDVHWDKNYEKINFNFLGERFHYPRDMKKEKWPQVGKEPKYEFKEKWPYVAMRARWTISTEGWPEKYRSEAIDLILMYACDAGVYEYIYPGVIKSSKFTSPPGFLKQAEDPSFRLAEAMRGKVVSYSVIAKGGFGAKDYEIKTKIRIGLSKDEKAVFYYDTPEYISDYLEERQFLFAGIDEGDVMHFEIVMFCKCTPRKTFQGEAIRRIKESGKYFVERLYINLDDAPTEKEIDDYLKAVRKGKRALKKVVKS